MKSRILTLVLLVGAVYGVVMLVPKLAAIRLPDNHRDFQPSQPIAYSHRLHAGELQMDCQYCHSGARRSRHAGIPTADVCMNCHGYVTATRAQNRAAELEAEEAGTPAPVRLMSDEIEKIYQALNLTNDRVPIAGGVLTPIQWVRVNHLPDFVAFDHRPHVAAGVLCQKCHGPIETMERVRQVESLGMGFCVDCHRTPGPTDPEVASTDCSTCHY